MYYDRPCSFRRKEPNPWKMSLLFRWPLPVLQAPVSPLWRCWSSVGHLVKRGGATDWIDSGFTARVAPDEGHDDWPLWSNSVVELKEREG